MDPTIAIEHIEVVADGPRDPHQMKKRAMLFGPDGQSVLTGIPMTGIEDELLVVPDSSQITDADTAFTAIARLQHQIEDAQLRITREADERDAGFDGTFRDGDGRTVTVLNGRITRIA